MTKSILICPKCNSPITAAGYMNPAILGALDSILPTITCSCGYVGLPVSVSVEDYTKLVEKSNIVDSLNLSKKVNEKD